MRFTYLRTAPLWVSLTVAPPLHAAASLSVDDAGIAADGTCQLESWSRAHRRHQELTLVPACTMAGTEWSLALGHLRAAGASPWAVGAKRGLPDPFGPRAQLAVAADLGGDIRRGGARGWTVGLPLSIVLDAHGHALVHVTTGWTHTRSTRAAMLGLGTELRISPHWSVLAETWRDADHQRGSQLGVRRQLRNDASIDLLAGRLQADASERWLTLGVNLPLAR